MAAKEGVYRNLKVALEEAGWNKVVLHSIPLGATGLTGDMQGTWKALRLDTEGGIGFGDGSWMSRGRAWWG